jgi:cytochrome c oxidase subunit 2
MSLSATREAPRREFEQFREKAGSRIRNQHGLQGVRLMQECTAGSNGRVGRWSRQAALIALGILWPGAGLWAQPGDGPQIPSIFAPESTPADQLYDLSLFVVAVCAGIFIVVFTLLAYSVVKFRRRTNDDGREPPQVYGSDQLEMAWTVIPVLIVVVLFLTSARVIHSVQDAHEPAGAIEVTLVGHQFWWEYRYTQYGFVAANELHVPVSDPSHPTPTFLTLLSADTDHSFWVPRLAGKTDLIPNKVNHLWIDPHRTGVYVGQCAQYCGVQHAKMLLRVYVQPRDQFDAWVKQQQQPAADDPAVRAGREVFDSTACINCHAIRGTVANGRFGPDLTHLMSRDTLGSGVLPNFRPTLRAWVSNPDAFKPGSRMPAMNLSDSQFDQLTAYLLTLR